MRRIESCNFLGKKLEKRFFSMEERLERSPIKQDVVCDFPLPCTPQMNAEKGMFVLRNILRLDRSIAESGFGAELPSNAYCGATLCGARSRRSAENRTAS